MEDAPPSAELILERIADVVRRNCGATSLFGYSATEALGQNLDLIIPSICGRVIGAVLQQPCQMMSSRCRAAEC